MDEIIKRRLKKIEKRLDAIEEFIQEFPVYVKTTKFEIGDTVDELYDKTLWMILQHDRVSASLIQRRMQIGFSRACRILEQLEINGIVSAANGLEPRKVLIKNEDLEELRQKLLYKQESLKSNKKKN